MYDVVVVVVVIACHYNRWSGLELGLHVHVYMPCHAFVFTTIV
jgi:hypothetical protein